VEALITLEAARPALGHGEPLGWPHESWREYADHSLTGDRAGFVTPQATAPASTTAGGETGSTTAS
jgi:hypothetical protein